MEITFEDNGSPLKKSKNRHGETCDQQLRRMCKNIAEDITAGNPDDKDSRTASAWMEDVYDIEWITYRDGSYKAARLLVAGGGPTIWVNVYTNEVEGYWASDKVIEPFIDNLELRAYLEEIHASSK